MKKKFSRYSLQDKTLLMTGYILLGLFVVAIIIPMIYIVVASFMDPITLQNKGITFDFSKWTLTAYERVFSNAQIWIGFRNAVIYSVTFTAVSVFITLLAAYPMSRPDFKGKGFFNVIFVITMFFGGGLIPTYLLIKGMGLLDTYTILVLLGMISTYNIIIMKNGFESTPMDLQEAAMIDGANDLTVFAKIMLPLQKPLIATFSLFTAVGYWNSWYWPMLLLSSGDKTVLQLFLRSIVNALTSQEGTKNMAASGQAFQNTFSQGVKMAAVFAVMLPIMVVYPFLQKYFVKGMLVGAVKM